MKSEALEAYIYPTEEFLKETSGEERKKRFDDIINEVNRELLPYQRIGKVKILDKAMEMGGTMKIKRYKVK